MSLSHVHPLMLYWSIAEFKGSRRADSARAEVSMTRTHDGMEEYLWGEGAGFVSWRRMMHVRQGAISNFSPPPMISITDLPGTFLQPTAPITYTLECTHAHARAHTQTHLLGSKAYPTGILWLP